MHIGRKSVIKHTSRASLVAFLLFDAEIVNLTKGKYWQHGIRFQQLYVLWICFYTLKFQLIFLVKWIVLMGASLAVEVKSIKILNNIVLLWYPLQQLKYCSTLLGIRWITYLSSGTRRPLHSNPSMIATSSGVSSKSKTLKFDSMRSLVTDFGITMWLRWIW